MQQTRFIMGMPVTIEVAGMAERKRRVTGIGDPKQTLKEVFDFFREVDKKFSTYKKSSEVSLINAGKLKRKDASPEVKKILKLSEQTKKQTHGFFDIEYKGKLDPSGIVKGWAIYEASKIIKKEGITNFYINAGGDIEAQGQEWTVGIRSPFIFSEVVKVLSVKNCGVATSGIYERGNHIYTPNHPDTPNPILSLTVIGPNVYEADRFATAAFAMGKKGIVFIENQKDLEGYMIDTKGIATFTSGFEKYTVKKNA